VSSSRNKADASKQNKNQKNKGKPALVTPLEYAQKLNLDLSKKRKSDYLKGKQILYVGGDMQYAGVQTRGRMDYVSFPCFALPDLPCFPVRYLRAIILWRRSSAFNADVITYHRHHFVNAVERYVSNMRFSDYQAWWHLGTIVRPYYRNSHRDRCDDSPNTESPRT
jgi:hypothetical protein